MNIHRQDKYKLNIQKKLNTLKSLLIMTKKTIIKVIDMNIFN